VTNPARPDRPAALRPPTRAAWVALVAVALLAAGCKNSPRASGGARSARGDTSATASDGAPDGAATGLNRRQQERYFLVDNLIRQWDELQQAGKDPEAAGIAEKIAQETDADFETFAASSRGEHGAQAQHLAVKAFGFSKRPEATSLLVTRLASDDQSLVGNALIALKIRSDPSTQLQPIVGLLRANYTEAKRYAPLALANITLARERIGRPVEDPTAELAMTGLVSLSQDRDPFVRLHTAKAMGALRRPEATDFLVLLFNDEHPKIRVAAAAAVERVGDARTFPQVVRLLESIPEDQKVIVRDILASYAERIQGRPLSPDEVKALGTSSIAWDRWYSQHNPCASRTPAPASAPRAPGRSSR
jgi:hypothetical protein